MKTRERDHELLFKTLFMVRSQQQCQTVINNYQSRKWLYVHQHQEYWYWSQYVRTQVTRKRTIKYKRNSLVGKQASSSENSLRKVLVCWVLNCESMTSVIGVWQNVDDNENGAQSGWKSILIGMSLHATIIVSACCRQAVKLCRSKIFFPPPPPPSCTSIITHHAPTLINFPPVDWVVEIVNRIKSLHARSKCYAQTSEWFIMSWLIQCHISNRLGFSVWLMYLKYNMGEEYPSRYSIALILNRQHSFSRNRQNFKYLAIICWWHKSISASEYLIWCHLFPNPYQFNSRPMLVWILATVDKC